ncbi:PQ-loop repeat-containing protein 1 [Paecilomyces lecythidis]
MLVASILKVFYWFGAYYSYSLLIQAIIMIFVQLLLLKVALDNRPAPGIKGGIEHAPFSEHEDSGRPYNFWKWRNTKPYWTFLTYFFLGLLFIHVFLPFISRSESYISLLGIVGLAVEAFLPVPQVLANQRSRSCKGFRLSVLASWIIGDAMKMSYFFGSKQVIPWSFRMCGMFQCVCDCYLGIQYWMFGEGPSGIANSPRQSGDRWEVEEKDIRLA